MAKSKASSSALAPEKQTIVDAMIAGGDWEVLAGDPNIKMAAGDVITGRIVKAPYKAGKSAAFDIEIHADNGDETLSYWCPTVLQNLLKNVKDGDTVKIRCLGKVLSTSNGTAWDFLVAVKR